MAVYVCSFILLYLPIIVISISVASSPYSTCLDNVYFLKSVTKSGKTVYIKELVRPFFDFLGAITSIIFILIPIMIWIDGYMGFMVYLAVIGIKLVVLVIYGGMMMIPISRLCSANLQAFIIIVIFENFIEAVIMLTLVCD